MDQRTNKRSIKQDNINTIDDLQDSVTNQKNAEIVYSSELKVNESRYNKKEISRMNFSQKIETSDQEYSWDLSH
jgi:hypothetical protein